MNEKLLIELNQQDIFPFENESDEQFWLRSKDTKKQGFSYRYSKENLRFFELACTLIHENEATVELNPIFIHKQKIMGITKEELIEHEKVHFLRRGFHGNQYEEALAYLTSKNQFRKVFGGLIRTPKESIGILIVLFFLPILSFFGDYFYWILGSYLLGAAYLGIRTIYTFFRLNRLIHQLQKIFSENAWAVLMRLAEKEIKLLSNLEELEIRDFFLENNHSLRIRQIALSYLKR